VTSPAEDSIRRLRMRTTTADDGIVIRCAGRLTSEYTDQLRQEFMRVLPGAKRIVLDLSDLRRMDSSGLGALVRLYVSARSAHCELQLINLTPRVKELLGLANVLSMFTACGQYMTRLP
jgi:anti-sigma B factor antagonist